MANPDHVKWLLEGVERWNKRRKGGWLTSALKDVDLQGADLRGANLRGAKLQGADLQGADLQSADLQGAKLQGADLQGAKLQKANPEVTVLLEAKLEKADLEKVYQEWRDLTKMYLEEPILFGADLQGADLRGADLRGAKLQVANLQGANLLGANLLRVDLQGAKMQKTNLREASVRSAWSGGSDKRLEPPLLQTDLLDLTLTQDQLDMMIGDSATIIPKGLTRPDHWEITHDGANPAPAEEEEPEEVEPPVDPPSEQNAKAEETLSQQPSSPPWIAKVPMPVKFEWGLNEKGQAQIRFAPPDPTPLSPGPKETRDGILKGMRRTASTIAKSIGDVGADNAAKQVKDYLEDVVDLCAADPDEVIIFSLRHNMVGLKFMIETASEALEDISHARLRPLLDDWDQLRRFYPQLEGYEAPGSNDHVPETAVAQISAVSAAASELIASDEAEQVLSAHDRNIIKAEANKPERPSIDSDAQKREKAKALGGIFDRLEKALSDRPDWLEGVAIYAGTITAVGTLLVWVRQILQMLM